MADLKAFVEAPSLENLETLKKAELIEVCKLLEVEAEIKRSFRKDQLKHIIIDHLVDNDMLSGEALQKYPSLDVESPGLSELKHLEVEKEIRLAEKELEKVQIQVQKEIKLKELELKERELEVRAKEIELKKPQGDPTIGKFNLSKHVRTVPVFNENEVEKYFQHFEKVAVSLEWPKKMWPVLLQSVLKGKAQETYSSLCEEESFDYERVKMAILKAYELVPEAYRQKFRTFRKCENQTFVEFAHEKETYFDRWCSAKQVGHEFDRLRQVILVEEFKRCVRDDIKVHLDEQNVQTLAKAASMADDYALTHKNHFGRNKNNGSSKSNSFGGKNPQGNVLTNSPSAQNSQASSQSDSMGKKPTKSFIPTCGHCGKRGHVMSDCWSLKRKKENQASLNAFVLCKPNCLVLKEVDNSEASAKTEEIRPEFQPFISEGSVSIDKLSGSVPIMIL